jgi:hypothetical protein
MKINFVKKSCSDLDLIYTKVGTEKSLDENSLSQISLASA